MTNNPLFSDGRYINCINIEVIVSGVVVWCRADVCRAMCYWRQQTAGFQNTEFRIQASEFRLQNSDFRIQTSDFRIQLSLLSTACDE